MPEESDWSAATYEGNRRRQHEEFRALPFRQKLAAIEKMGRVARYFAQRRRAKRDQKAEGRSDKQEASSAARSPHGRVSPISPN